MRKWMAAHRRVLAVVAVALAWGAGMALFVSWGHPLDQVLFNAARWAVFVGASWYFDARRQQRQRPSSIPRAGWWSTSDTRMHAPVRSAASGTWGRVFR